MQPTEVRRLFPPLPFHQKLYLQSAEGMNTLKVWVELGEKKEQSEPRQCADFFQQWKLDETIKPGTFNTSAK